MVVGDVWITFFWGHVGEDDDGRIVLFVVHCPLLRNLHFLAIEDLVHECDWMLAVKLIEDDEFIGFVEAVEEVFHRSAVVSGEVVAELIA